MTKLTSLSEAIHKYVNDGDTIYAAGFTHLIPFAAGHEIIRQGSDVTPHTEQIETFPQRVLIAATDIGQMLRGQLEDLEKLVDAYRRGVLVENSGGARAVR